MRRTRLGVCCVFVALLATLPTTAQAGEVIRFSGRGASASFFSTNPSGCVGTDVFVQFGESTFKILHSQEDPISIAATMSIFQFDSCTGTQLMAASPPLGAVTLPNQAVQIDKQLNSATLNATIELFDSVSNSLLSAEVNLTWTATGDHPTRTRFHFHGWSPGLIVNTISKGLSRPAEALGSVSVGLTNFISSPAFAGQLFAEMDSEVRNFPR